MLPTAAASVFRRGRWMAPHADFTVFDLSASYPIDPADFLSLRGRPPPSPAGRYRPAAC